MFSYAKLCEEGKLPFPLNHPRLSITLSSSFINTFEARKRLTEVGHNISADNFHRLEISMKSGATGQELQDSKGQDGLQNGTFFLG